MPNTVKCTKTKSLALTFLLSSLFALISILITTHSYAVAATVANDGAVTARLSENSGCIAFVCTNGAVTLKLSFILFLKKLK